VHLTLVELSSSQQATALRERRLDVGFVRPPLPESDLLLEVILREPLIAVLPEAHPVASASAIALSMLADEPFVLFPPQLGPALHARILGACERAGFSPRVTQEAVGQPTMVSLVSVGIGVSLLPASIEQLPWQGVTYRPLLDDVPPVELALAYRRDERSPVRESFLAVAREATSG
jgi:DNA-binding transcriptional LysR family regulator